MSIHRALTSFIAASIAITSGLFVAAPLHAKGKAGADGPRIDFDKLEKVVKAKGKEQVLDAAELPPVPEQLYNYAHPAGVWLPGKRDLVQQTVKCSDKRCALRILRKVRNGSGLDTEAQVDLPPLPHGIDELEFLPLTVLDIDGDHKDEVLVRYRIKGKPRPGAEPVSTDMLAVLSYPEMTLALQHELRESGHDGPEAECKYDVVRHDVNGDKRTDLQFIHSCVCAKGSDGCHTGPDSPEEYAVGADRRFTRYFPPK